MALQNIRRKSAAAGALIGLGALLVGCSRDAAMVSGTPTGVPGVPVAVACEPNQRAVVRQVAVGGAVQSQVQCESVTPGFAGGQPAYQSGFQPVNYVQPALEPTRIVQAAHPQEVVVREAAPRRVSSYQRAPARVVVRQPKRSVQKSAIIIGSSAGVGAGIGAAVGGKKGAGIGALLGGGGAAIWDQITRRKQ